MPGDNIVSFPKTAAQAAPQRQGRLLIPGRLREARKAMRLSQEQLGRAVGVTRQAISAYERGDKFPEPAIFERLANVLEQPISFFTAQPAPLFGDMGTRFCRKFGPETVRRNEACEVLGQWFVQVAKYFDDYVNYPDVDLPEGTPSGAEAYSVDDINEIALELRRRWGLGPGPLSNVLALLESKGILICKYELEGEQVEAFSFWNGHRPFIFLASEKEAAVRQRFDLAHELGHLILHRWVKQSELLDKARLKAIEKEADRFAAAFLLPYTSFPNEVYSPKLDAFVPLKQRWKVSIQAMIHRCRDLEIIDEDQNLNLYKQISFRKWRKKEPLDDPAQIPFEQARLLRRAVSLVTESGRKHPEDILAEIRLSPRWIETFCNLAEGAFREGREIVEINPTLR
jgi:Zn-dependent peptidase ImmA (M78 family)/DNA-binding XRE family transcriptional regulator